MVDNNYPQPPARRVSAEEFKRALCSAIQATSLPQLMGWPLEAKLIVKTAGAGWAGGFYAENPNVIELGIGEGSRDVL